MVPMKYKGLGFERYDSDAYNKEAVATMKGLVAETEKGAFVYGPPGTGKSMLVAVFATCHSILLLLVADGGGAFLGDAGRGERDGAHKIL